MKIIDFLSFLCFCIERFFVMIICSFDVIKNDIINENNYFHERINFNILV